MFESSKGRYLTRGINENVCIELQIFLWKLIDELPEPRDYLQVFDCEVTASGLQRVIHRQEQPEYRAEYVLTDKITPVEDKIYMIDDGEHCTMLFASEY